MRQSLLFLSFLVFINGMGFAQKNTPNQRGTTLYLGGSYGFFESRRELYNVYGSKIPIYAAQVGFGYKDAQIIGKFHQITALGKPKVVNISITSQAEWKEEILALGVRKFAETTPIYCELLYLMMKADESISTSQPVLPELASKYSIRDQGIAVSVGYAPKLIGPLGAFIEVQWNYMFQEDENSSGKSIPNLGGFFFSAGLHLTIY